MIIPVFMLVAGPILLCIALGTRSRDNRVRTLAFGAVILMLATVAGWCAMAYYGLPGSTVRARILWFMTMPLCLTIAITLGFVAWRRSKRIHDDVGRYQTTWAPRLLLGFASWTVLVMALGSATMLSPAVHALYVRVMPSVLRPEMIFVAPFAILIAWVASIWHAIVDPTEHEPPRWLIVIMLAILPGVGIGYYFFVVLWLNPAEPANPVALHSETP